MATTTNTEHHLLKHIIPSLKGEGIGVGSVFFIFLERIPHSEVEALRVLKASHIIEA
jgi:hypothetical protein